MMGRQATRVSWPDVAGRDFLSPRVAEVVVPAPARLADALVDCGAGGEGGDPILDAAGVVRRLEEAGRTLLAMPGRGVWPAGYRSGMPEMVRDFWLAYASEDAVLTLPRPGSAEISRMEATWAWYPLITDARRRRIVGMRSLVHPLTERHLFTWRRCGRVLRADHKSVQAWHREGILAIVLGLVKLFLNPTPQAPQIPL